MSPEQQQVTPGHKRCRQCGAVVGVRLRICDCGYEFPTRKKGEETPEMRDRRLAAQRIEALTTEDLVLLLKQLDRIKTGVAVDQPTDAKPTADDFAAAIGDTKKQNQLKKTLDAWNAYEESNLLSTRFYARLHGAWSLLHPEEAQAKAKARRKAKT